MLHSLTLAALSLGATPALPAPVAPQVAELPYEEVAQRFLAAHGLTGKSPEQVDLTELLAAEFFATRVGVFDVRIPSVSLEDKVTTKDYRDVCAALCRAQARWVEWLAPESEEGQALVEDLEAQRKWIEKWPVKLLEKLDETAARGALDLFEADEETRARSARLATRLENGGVLDLSLETPAPIRLVLMPERRGFVEFLAFTGWHNPELRSIYWAPGIENWTEFRIQDLQVMALQYPAVAPAPGDYSGSSSMKDRDVKGLEQQVVQLAMNKLLAYMHGEAVPNSVIRGLSINLLIDMYGSCHTRNDGDLRGRVTQKREMFVRGGRSEGGTLPPNVAENRWRSEYGKHRYTRILKQAQRSGASEDKRNKNKLNTFLLVGDDDKDRAVVHAPLLGPGAAEAETPPATFSMDYAEFLRAYNVAFMHYLRSEAGGSRKDSAEKFAALMTRVAEADAEQSFGGLVEELYGLELSNAEVDNDCIEGRFLKWLSKQ